MKKITYRLAIIRDDGHEIAGFPIQPVDAACRSQEWNDWLRKLLANCPPQTAEPVSSPGSTAPAAADNSSGHLFKIGDVVVHKRSNDNCDICDVLGITTDGQIYVSRRHDDMRILDTANHFYKYQVIE